MGRQKREAPTDEVVKIITSNTLEESARILKISTSTVRKICLDNDIEFVRITSVSRQDWGARKKLIIAEWASENMNIFQLSKKTGFKMWMCCNLVGLPTLPLALCHLRRGVVEQFISEVPDGMSMDEYMSFIIAEAYGD